MDRQAPDSATEFEDEAAAAQWLLAQCRDKQSRGHTVTQNDRVRRLKFKGAGTEPGSNQIRLTNEEMAGDFTKRRAKVADAKKKPGFSGGFAGLLNLEWLPGGTTKKKYKLGASRTTSAAGMAQVNLNASALVPGSSTAAAADVSGGSGGISTAYASIMGGGSKRSRRSSAASKKMELRNAVAANPLNLVREDIEDVTSDVDEGAGGSAGRGLAEAAGGLAEGGLAAGGVEEAGGGNRETEGGSRQVPRSFLEFVDQCTHIQLYCWYGANKFMEMFEPYDPAANLRKILKEMPEKTKKASDSSKAATADALCAVRNLMATHVRAELLDALKIATPEELLSGFVTASRIRGRAPVHVVVAAVIVFRQRQQEMLSEQNAGQQSPPASLLRVPDGTLLGAEMQKVYHRYSCYHHLLQGTCVIMVAPDKVDFGDLGTLEKKKGCFGGPRLVIRANGVDGFCFYAEYGDSFVSLSKACRGVDAHPAMRLHSKTLYDPATAIDVASTLNFAWTRQAMDDKRIAEVERARARWMRACAGEESGCDHQGAIADFDDNTAATPVEATFRMMYVEEFEYRESILARQMFENLKGVESLSVDHMFPSRGTILLTIVTQHGLSAPVFVGSKGAEEVGRLAEEINRCAAGLFGPDCKTACPSLQRYWTDCDCCAGWSSHSFLGGEDGGNELGDLGGLLEEFGEPNRDTAMTRAMSKLAGRTCAAHLDEFHLLQRAARATDESHPWHADFLRELSGSLYVLDEDEYVAALEFVRQQAAEKKLCDSSTARLRREVLQDSVLRRLRDPLARCRMWVEVVVKYYTTASECGPLLTARGARSVLRQLPHVRWCLHQGEALSIDSTRFRNGIEKPLPQYYYFRNSSKNEMTHGTQRKRVRHIGSCSAATAHAMTMDVHNDYNVRRASRLELAVSNGPLRTAADCVAREVGLENKPPVLDHPFGFRFLNRGPSPSSSSVAPLSTWSADEIGDLELDEVSPAERLANRQQMVDDVIDFVQAERGRGVDVVSSMIQPPPPRATEISNMNLSHLAWSAAMKERVRKTLTEIIGAATPTAKHFEKARIMINDMNSKGAHALDAQPGMVQTSENQLKLFWKEHTKRMQSAMADKRPEASCVLGLGAKHADEIHAGGSSEEPASGDGASVEPLRALAKTENEEYKRLLAANPAGPALKRFKLCSRNCGNRVTAESHVRWRPSELGKGMKKICPFDGSTYLECYNVREAPPPDAKPKRVMTDAQKAALVRAQATAAAKKAEKRRKDQEAAGAAEDQGALVS
eukprot:g18824.t1